MKFTTTHAVTALGAIVIVAAGVFSGRALNADRGEGFTFDTTGPAYEAGLPAAGLSKGGFSGFGETTGLEGNTQLSGKIVSVSAQEIVIESRNGLMSTFRLGGAPGGISRIDSSSRAALQAGLSVVVRHEDGSDVAEAVLILEAP